MDAPAREPKPPRGKRPAEKKGPAAASTRGVCVLLGAPRAHLKGHVFGLRPLELVLQPAYREAQRALRGQCCPPGTATHIRCRILLARLIPPGVPIRTGLNCAVFRDQVASMLLGEAPDGAAPPGQPRPPVLYCTAALSALKRYLAAVTAHTATALLGEALEQGGLEGDLDEALAGALEREHAEETSGSAEAEDPAEAEAPASAEAPAEAEDPAEMEAPEREADLPRQIKRRRERAPSPGAPEGRPPRPVLPILLPPRPPARQQPTPPPLWIPLWCPPPALGPLLGAPFGVPFALRLALGSPLESPLGSPLGSPLLGGPSPLGPVPGPFGSGLGQPLPEALLASSPGAPSPSLKPLHASPGAPSPLACQAPRRPGGRGGAAKAEPARSVFAAAEGPSPPPAARTRARRGSASPPPEGPRARWGGRQAARLGGPGGERWEIRWHGDVAPSDPAGPPAAPPRGRAE